MRRIVTAAALAALGTGCSSAPPAEVIFPHEASRIDGVCEPPSATGSLGVSVEAPFENTGLRRFRIINTTALAHEVHPDFIVENTGRCDRGWGRSSRLELEDNASCEPPGPGTLAPSASIEIRLPPRRERVVDGACTKVGLALFSHVDGQLACFELGSWIIYRPGED